MTAPFSDWEACRMSAFGTKRTLPAAEGMSAFMGNADMNLSRTDVR
jgi:hypothetical protein